MSERSERIIVTVFFAAQRRSRHWCPDISPIARASHDWMLHQ